MLFSSRRKPGGAFLGTTYSLTSVSDCFLFSFFLFVIVKSGSTKANLDERQFCDKLVRYSNASMCLRFPLQAFIRKKADCRYCSYGFRHYPEETTANKFLRFFGGNRFAFLKFLHPITSRLVFCMYSTWFWAVSKSSWSSKSLGSCFEQLTIATAQPSLTSGNCNLNSLSSQNLSMEYLAWSVNNLCSFYTIGDDCAL